VASPQRPLSIDINTVAQVMRILAGIVSDSGGAGLPLGVAIPIPIPPWGPEFEQLPRRLQDATAGRALLQVAGMIREAGLRVRVESIARELLGGRFGMR